VPTERIDLLRQQVAEVQARLDRGEWDAPEDEVPAILQTLLDRARDSIRTYEHPRDMDRRVRP